MYVICIQRHHQGTTAQSTANDKHLYIKNLFMVLVALLPSCLSSPLPVPTIPSCLYSPLPFPFWFMSLPGLCVSVCLCNICLSVFSSVCPAVCLLSSPLPVPIPYLPVSLLSSYPSCLPSFLPSLPPFNSACHLHPFLSDAHSFIASCLMFPHPSPMPPVTAIPSCHPPPPPHNVGKN